MGCYRVAYRLHPMKTLQIGVLRPPRCWVCPVHTGLNPRKYGALYATPGIPYLSTGLGPREQGIARYTWNTLFLYRLARAVTPCRHRLPCPDVPLAQASEIFQVRVGKVEERKFPKTQETHLPPARRTPRTPSPRSAHFSTLHPPEASLGPLPPGSRAYPRPSPPTPPTTPFPLFPQALHPPDPAHASAQLPLFPQALEPQGPHVPRLQLLRLPQTGRATSRNLAAHGIARPGIHWAVQHPSYSHKLTTFERAPSYTHRGSVSTETAHKVNSSENLFRQRIPYGKWRKIPSPHPKSVGKSVCTCCTSSRRIEGLFVWCSGRSGQSVPGGRTHAPGTLQTHGYGEERPPQRRTVD